MEQLWENIESMYEKIEKLTNSEKDAMDYLSHLEQYYNSQCAKQTKSQIVSNIKNNFMYNNTIYYNKTSRIYFNYMYENYVACNEDSITCYILEYLRSNKIIDVPIDTSTKHVCKNEIVRSIRDCSIYDNIPDTETIQGVLNILVPNIFIEKSHAKLFLISIGDIILKKYNISGRDECNEQNDHDMLDHASNELKKVSNECKNKRTLFFMKSCMRGFLQEISKIVSIYFCNMNISSHIKYKYTNEHETFVCWVIPSNDINFKYLKFNEQFYINMICVAIHYSNRYSSFFDFINMNEGVNENVTEKVTMLSGGMNKKKKVIDDFCDKYLIKEENQSITEKDILFLWKRYNSSQEMFVNIFPTYNDFIECLLNTRNPISYLTQYDNNETNKNVLYGYYSLDIPNISLFCEFWETYFEEDDSEYYLELTEILQLFNKIDKHKKHNFNETLIMYILQVSYPNVNIIQNKIIHGYKCHLWNKQKEILEFIESKKFMPHKMTQHELYLCYCKTSTNKFGMNISKKYFTRYIEDWQTSSVLKQIIENNQ
jgi:hypothetical protein